MALSFNDLKRNPARKVLIPEFEAPDNEVMIRCLTVQEVREWEKRRDEIIADEDSSVGIKLNCELIAQCLQDSSGNAICTADEALQIPIDKMHVLVKAIFRANGGNTDPLPLVS